MDDTDAVVIIIAALVLAAAAIAAAVVVARSTRDGGPSLVGETVVVHTRRPDDQSIRGVVVGDHADRLILRQAVILVSADVRHEIPDIAEIPRAAISWWQRLEARG